VGGLLEDLIYKAIGGDKIRGNVGERRIKRSLSKADGMTLNNLYITKEDGTTTEIDMVQISPKGIFVIESKNYSGWIFGNERYRNWTENIYGTKHQFYNPIWQNKGHIGWLAEYLKGSGMEGIPFFNLVCFSDGCELKKMTVTSPDVRVMRRSEIRKVIEHDFAERPDVLNAERMEAIVACLEPLKDVKRAVKKQHVRDVKSKAAKICPMCGGQLVERTGRNGSKFYGCSNFHRTGCGYTEDFSRMS
jgi:predicted RNA-binding Zn-ribbon protein involved in translation (DUF1610 family)